MAAATLIDSIDRITFSDVTTFNKEFVDKGIPVIITDMVPKWEAYENWSDLEYLKSKAGHRKTPLYRYLDDRSGKPISTFGGVSTFRGRIQLAELKLGDYIEHLQAGNNLEYYLADADIVKYLPELSTDFELFDWLLVYKNGRPKDPTRPFLYMGIDNYTPNHIHMDNHAILCQVVGEKRSVLYHPNDSRNLYPHSLLGSVNPFHSQIEDIENVDLEKFPRFAKAKGIEIILKAGECLYIPTHWWHVVYSPGLSIAVTMSNLNRSNMITTYPYPGTRSAIARSYIKLTSMFGPSEEDTDTATAEDNGGPQ